MFVRCLSGRWVDGEVASSSGTLGFVATLAERIKRILRTSSRPLDDDELAGRLGVIRQAVNQVCRRLEAQGLVRREVGPYNKIVNTLVDVAARGGAAVRPTQAPVSVGPVSVSQDLDQPIGEDAVKAAVRDFLAARGLHVEVRWGRDRGVDITATGPDERWIVEAKGEVLSPQQQGNYFLGALGELVQRMDDPHARYALALPDTPRCRGLVRRLPDLARQRLMLTVFFVRRDGTVTPDPSP